MGAPDPCQPLCFCGIRGCDQADLHAAAYAPPVPLFRLRSKASRRHRRKR